MLSFGTRLSCYILAIIHARQCNFPLSVFIKLCNTFLILVEDKFRLGRRHFIFKQHHGITATCMVSYSRRSSNHPDTNVKT